MAGKIIADTLEHSTAGSLDTQYVVNGSAKGYVAFNGTGTIASDDSFNLSSLVDAGTGDYDATWVSSMGTSIYMLSGMKSHSVSDSSCNLKVASRSSNFTASTVRVRSIEGGSANDSDYVSMMCHGDLA